MTFAVRVAVGAWLRKWWTASWGEEFESDDCGVISFAIRKFPA